MKVFIILMIIIFVATYSSAQQGYAFAKSEDSSFSVRLSVPTSQKVGELSKVRIQIFDLDGPLRDLNFTGYSIVIRLMEKDVGFDDLIEVFTVYKIEVTEFELDETYEVDLLKDLSPHSEIYVEVEVKLFKVLCSEKASTKDNPIKVRKIK